MSRCYAHKAVQTDNLSQLRLEPEPNCTRIDSAYIHDESLSVEKEHIISPRQASSAYLSCNRPTRVFNKEKRIVSLPDMTRTEGSSRDTLSLPRAYGSSLRIVSLPKIVRQPAKSPSQEYLGVSVELAHDDLLQADSTHIENQHLTYVSPTSSLESALVGNSDSIPKSVQAFRTTPSNFYHIKDEIEISERVITIPRPIPALHGPLSLPYARCPSGAEGIIIEDADLHGMVWGLDIDGQPDMTRATYPISRSANKAQILLKAPPIGSLSRTGCDAQDSSRNLTTRYMTDHHLRPRSVALAQKPVLPCNESSNGEYSDSNPINDVNSSLAYEQALNARFSSPSLQKHSPYQFHPIFPSHMSTEHNVFHGSCGLHPSVGDFINDYPIERPSAVSLLPSPTLPAWPLAVSPLVSPYLESGFYNMQSVPTNTYPTMKSPFPSGNPFNEVLSAESKLEGYVELQRSKFFNMRSNPYPDLAEDILEIPMLPCRDPNYVLSPGLHRLDLSSNTMQMTPPDLGVSLSNQPLISSGRPPEELQVWPQLKSDMEQCNRHAPKSKIPSLNPHSMLTRSPSRLEPIMSSRGSEAGKPHIISKTKRQHNRKVKSDGRSFNNPMEEKIKRRQDKIGTDNR